jgi:DNA-binding transcriptional MerR regulator
MNSISARHLLRVGDVARLTGKSVRAIHLYEEMGLLNPATRSSGGFRLFDRSAPERVRWIELLHGMGFSLQQMRELLHSWWNAGRGQDAMEELRALFEKKLADTRDAIRRHEQIEKELVQGLAYLEACRRCESPLAAVNGCTCCKQDHGMESEPALVAGITFAPESASRGRRPAIVRSEDIE